MAGAGYTGIFQQLVPNDQPTVVLVRDVPDQRSGQLIRARRIERISVINADVDHLRRSAVPCSSICGSTPS